MDFGFLIQFTRSGGLGYRPAESSDFSRVSDVQIFFGRLFFGDTFDCNATPG